LLVCCGCLALSKKTLETALAHDSHLLVQVKDNQPGLLEACRLIAAHHTAQEVATDTCKGYGRVEERHTQVFDPPNAWWPAEWAALTACLIQVTRHSRRRGPGGVWQTTEETALYICTTLLPAAVLAAAIRGHWGIENRLHYVRDVSFREDRCRVRHQPGILARLRTIAHNIIQHNQLPNRTEAIFKNALSFDHLIGLKGL
jgi:predicted transposase YbfD/YdcC